MSQRLQDEEFVVESVLQPILDLLRIHLPQMVAVENGLGFPFLRPEPRLKVDFCCRPILLQIEQAQPRHQLDRSDWSGPFEAKKMNCYSRRIHRFMRTEPNWSQSLTFFLSDDTLSLGISSI